MTIQNRSHNRVKSITIDSLVFIDNEMPYSGYFVTTWTFDKRVEQTIAEMIQNGPGDKFVRTKKTLYVEIESIRYNYNNELEWHTLWGSAASALE